MYELVRNLARQGHQVHVFSAWPEGGLSGPRTSCSHLSARGTPFLYLQYLLTVIYLSLFKQFDAIYTRNTPFGVIGTFFFKLFQRARLVCEVNGIADDEFDLEQGLDPKASRQEVLAPSVRDRMNRKLAKFSEYYVISKADGVIAVTGGIKQYIIDRYGLPEARVSVIANGANTDIFTPRSQQEARRLLGLPDSDSYICFVGNFAPWQGVESLIQAVPSITSRYPCVRVILVGDGAMKQAWTDLANSLGILEHILFTGVVPYEDVPFYISASDICVAPFISRRNERIGLSPLKIYEYLACGRPVVASKINGITGLLARSGGGIAVMPENPHELAEAILYLLQDDNLRGEMGDSGCTYVMENHTWAKVAADVAGVLTGSAKGVSSPLDMEICRQRGRNE
ncbi:MAG: glycosyltransferase family 4 protein [Methanoculleus sp.]|nr:glycosyltransferase family 4 protein [Methanoculleus sp.]